MILPVASIMINIANKTTANEIFAKYYGLNE